MRLLVVAGLCLVSKTAMWFAICSRLTLVGSTGMPFDTRSATDWSGLTSWSAPYSVPWFLQRVLRKRLYQALKASNPVAVARWFDVLVQRVGGHGANRPTHTDSRTKPSREEVQASCPAGLWQALKCEGRAILASPGPF